MASLNVANKRELIITSVDRFPGTVKITTGGVSSGTDPVVKDQT